MTSAYRGRSHGEDLHASAGGGAIAGTPDGPSGWRRYWSASAIRIVMERVMRAGWALADQCIVSAANFLTIYLLARHMGTSGFGAFMLAYTGLMLLTSMQNALVIQPHNVLGAGLPKQEYRTFTGALVLMQAISCTGVGAALGAVGWLVSRSHSPATGSVLMTLAVAAVPWMGQEFVRRVLYTRSESRPAALNDMVTYGLQLAGVTVLSVYWADRASPEAALLVLGGSSLAGVVLGLWQLRDHVDFGKVSAGSFARIWKETWNFGKWLTGQNTLVWLGSHGHAWVVGLMLGAEQVGFYRAVTHLANIMNPLRQAAYSYLPSRGSLAYRAGSAAGLSRWVSKMSILLLLAVAPFSIVLVGFPGWVLTVAYGERYAGADLALILALSTIAQCITFSKFPFDIGLLALRETKWIFYVHLMPVLLLLTSGVGLVYFLGILGVPLSGIVINSALLFATWFAYAQLVKRRGNAENRT